MKCSITGCRNVGEWRFGRVLCEECFDTIAILHILYEQSLKRYEYLDAMRKLSWDLVFITPSKKMIDNRLAILRKQRNEMISTIIKMKNDYELTDDD